MKEILTSTLVVVVILIICLLYSSKNEEHQSYKKVFEGKVSVLYTPDSMDNWYFTTTEETIVYEKWIGHRRLYEIYSKEHHLPFGMFMSWKSNLGLSDNDVIVGIENRSIVLWKDFDPEKYLHERFF